MPFEAQVYEVVIASPGDVLRERDVVREVVHEWTTVHSRDRSIVLLPTGWETHAAPEMGGRAQEVINKQLIDRADILVGVFWTRIGSPTGEAQSGTVEEIQRHFKAGKPILLYFSFAPVDPDSVDQQQYNALKEFRTWCQENGLVERFDSTDEFRTKFTRQLAQTVIRELGTRPAAAEERPARFRPALTEEARELLLNAAQDPHGIIMKLRSMSGTHINTNGRSFVEEGNPRSEALWEGAIAELLAGDLIGRQGQMLKITRHGYEVADALRNEDSRATQRDSQSDARLSALAKEADDRWGVNGGIGSILDRERGLSEEEQVEFARRAYAARGRDPDEGVAAVIQWRLARSKSLP